MSSTTRPAYQRNYEEEGDDVQFELTESDINVKLIGTLEELSHDIRINNNSDDNFNIENHRINNFHNIQNHRINNSHNIENHASNSNNNRGNRIVGRGGESIVYYGAANGVEQERDKNPYFKIPKRPTSEQLLWLLTLARNEWWLLIVGSVALIASSAVTLLLPNYVGTVIDGLLTGRLHLPSLLLSFLVLVVLIAVTSLVKQVCYTVAGERVVARLRKTLFASMLVQDIAFFDVTSTGELINRLSSDTKALESAVTSNLAQAIRQLLQALGGVAILLYLSWKLSLLMLAVIPPLTVGVVVYGIYVKSLGRKVQDMLARASEVAQESLGNIRTVRSFAQEGRHKRMYDTVIDESYALAKRLAFIGGTFHSGVMFIGNLSLLGVIAFGAYLVQDNQMTVGALTSFLIYTFFVATAVGILSILYFDIVKALGATERVHSLISRKPNITCDSGTGETLESVTGLIEFKQLSFAYPSRPNNPVLSNFDLHLSPGEVVALVGQSGGGKSTIATLLQRFYDPDHGNIQLDGIDIRDLDIMWYRGLIGCVSQERKSNFSSFVNHLTVISLHVQSLSCTIWNIYS